MKARSFLWVVAAPATLLAACSTIDGQCWSVAEDGQGGASGGPIVTPGTGGFEDVPPKPQDASGPPPPDCLMVEPGACEKRCVASYQSTAIECEKINDEAQRKSCDDNAYATYKSCRDRCQADLNDCYDKCDAIADKEREKCKKMDPGPGQAKCNQAVEEQRAACYEECRKKK